MYCVSVAWMRLRNSWLDGWQTRQASSGKRIVPATRKPELVIVVRVSKETKQRQDHKVLVQVAGRLYET